MGKSCGNCANGTWTKGMDAIPEVCLKCEYVHGEPSNWKEKTMTNADRIRAMSDEELAEWLCSISTAECCDRSCPARDMCDIGDNGMIKWLKQPAETEPPKEIDYEQT